MIGARPDGSVLLGNRHAIDWSTHSYVYIMTSRLAWLSHAQDTRSGTVGGTRRPAKSGDKTPVSCSDGGPPPYNKERVVYCGSGSVRAIAQTKQSNTMSSTRSITRSLIALRNPVGVAPDQ